LKKGGTQKLFLLFINELFLNNLPAFQQEIDTNFQATCYGWHDPKILGQGSPKSSITSFMQI